MERDVVAGGAVERRTWPRKAAGERSNRRRVGCLACAEVVYSGSVGNH